MTWRDRPRDPPSIVCPFCGRRSFHPTDVEYRFCAACGFWGDYYDLIELERAAAAEREREPERGRMGGSRAEHLEWCKGRALAYLPDQAQAYASFASDMGKHPETRDHAMLKLGILFVMRGEADAAFIEGFR